MIATVTCVIFYTAFFVSIHNISPYMSALKHIYIYLLRSRAIKKMCSVVTLHQQVLHSSILNSLPYIHFHLFQSLPSFAPYTHSDKNSKMKIKTLLLCMIANHICGLTAHLRESFLVSENVDNFMIANIVFFSSSFYTQTQRVSAFHHV